MITINATMAQMIKIGHQGENNAVQIVFDLESFQSAFSGGHPQLVVRRPGDQSGYPVALIVDGSQAIWIVSASDTEKSGHGQCEMQWFVGDTLAKSDKYNFLIYSSIPGDAEPPDVPSKAWFEKILLLISGLTDRLNALADSDDTTLDQLSEVVAYIKANRDLIASITTDKVSVSDIVNDLVTNVTNKPLSAAQGVVLKALIDAITIPDKLPNPNALTFTGAVTGSYDGSKPLTVNVPSVTVDSSLTVEGQAADAKAVGDAISSLSGNKVNLPKDESGAIQNGTDGQILQTNGDGTTQWVDKPEGGGVSGDYIPAPASAEVGQTIVVKSVDENGKPTEWEPVTLPKQVQADWNQNDSSAADYVKNRTHYEESAYTDYVLNMGTVITGFSMPEVGETTTVKINGVESAETVKEATSSIVGLSYKYIGNIDFDSLQTGGTGWLVAEVQGQVAGYANPDTTISIETIVVHKISDKFINFDGFVRTFDYYFTGYTIYKTLYNDDGNGCNLYMCNNFILPEENSQLFGFMREIGFSKVDSIGQNSCFVIGYIISSVDGSINTRSTVFGTDTSGMEELAAEYGFTHTTNPKA